MASKVVDITAVKDRLQKQSKELKNAMHRASQLGAAAAQKNGRSGGGKGGGGGKQSAETGDGTFLTGVPERQRQLPTIVELQVFASEDLQERLDALAQAIGLEGANLLKGALQAEFAHICRLSREDEKESLMRQGKGMENKELRQLLKEEQKARVAAQASDEVLQEQVRINTQRTQELFAKNEALQSMDSQLRQDVARRDEEIVSLKESVHEANLRARAEETEKLKVLERLRRKEVEIGKATESIDALTTQLQHLGAERDSLHAQLAEIKNRFHEQRQCCDVLQEESEKIKSQMRVLRRNLQHQMPEEFRRVSQRVDALEKEKRHLEGRIKELEGDDAGSGLTIQGAVLRIAELTVEKKVLEEKLGKLRTEKETEAKKLQSELRLTAQRSKSLLEQKVGAVQQQQNEDDSRMALKVRVNSLDTDVWQLRRKNMELLNQVHTLDDAKARAEKVAAQAVSRAKELEDRLTLVATLHKLDLGKLQFSAGARTEDDVDRLFPYALQPSSTTTRHASSSSSRPPSAPTSRTPSAAPCHASLLSALAPSHYSNLNNLDNISTRPPSSTHTHTSSRPPSSKKAPSRPASAAPRPPPAPGGGGGGGGGVRLRRPVSASAAVPASASRVAAAAVQGREDSLEAWAGRPSSAAAAVGAAVGGWGGGDLAPHTHADAPHTHADAPHTHAPHARKDWLRESERERGERERVSESDREMYTLWSAGVDPQGLQREAGAGGAGGGHALQGQQEDGGAAGAEELVSRIYQLQLRLDHEAQARIGAQEHVLNLAQQLIDKEKALRELRTDIFVARGSPVKVGGAKRTEHARSKALELEADNLALLTKLRELELQGDKLSATLRQRDALAKTHAKTVSDLLFRVEVIQEEKAHLAHRLATVDPSYAHSASHAAALASASPADSSSSRHRRPPATAATAEEDADKSAAKAAARGGGGGLVNLTNLEMSERRRIWNEKGLQVLRRPSSALVSTTAGRGGAGADGGGGDRADGASGVRDRDESLVLTSGAVGKATETLFLAAHKEGRVEQGRGDDQQGEEGEVPRSEGGDADAVTDVVAEYTAGMLLSGLLCDADGIDASL